MKKEEEVVWPIRMSKELKNNFKNHCDELGYSMNKRIKILIKKDISDGENI